MPGVSLPVYVHLVSHPRLLFLSFQTLIDSNIEMRCICNICAYQSLMLPILSSFKK